nr:hypothetical protein [Sphingomonas sp. Y57]
MTEIKFTTTRAEMDQIAKIADRAEALGLLTGSYDRMTLIMDLSATHANGCPMDFARLAEADDFNLTHDITGIANTIDRETGKLAGFFLPRFSAPKGPEALAAIGAANRALVDAHYPA